MRTRLNVLQLGMYRRRHRRFPCFLDYAIGIGLSALVALLILSALR